MTIKEALSSSSITLTEAGIDSAFLDAEILLAYVLKKDRAFLLAHPERIMSKVIIRKYLLLIKKRQRRIPVAYLVGSKEFYGLNFLVTKDTLIPRPDTEALIEAVLEYISKHAAQTIVDVGTGSGCIAVTLAKHAPHLKKIYALDISPQALAVAKKNAVRLKVTHKIQFKKSNLLASMTEIYDIIIGNLPYLSKEIYSKSLKDYPEIQYEPRSALLAKNDGLQYIKDLLSQSKKRLSSRGALFLEIDPSQKIPLTHLVKKILPLSRISFVKDLAGKTRVAGITSSVMKKLT